MNYRIEHGKRSGNVIIYPCPRCGEELRSPLTDAGKREKCPVCSGELVVPGEAELSQWIDAQDRQRAEKAKIEEVERERAAASRPAAPVATAKAAAEQPGDYGGIVNGANVMQALSLIAYIVGTLLLLAGLLLLVQSSSANNSTGKFAGGAVLAAGIYNLLVGCLLALISSISLAIRDIARNTHPAMLHRVIRRALDEKSEQP